MSTTIKTIKNYLTDDTIYPITKASAVYMANSTIDTVEGKITQLEENKLEKINPQIPYNITFLASTNNIHWGEVPSKYLSGNYIRFCDIDGVPIGQVHSFQNTNGDQGIRILGYMGDPNSTDPSSTFAYHGFSVGTKLNGDPYFIPNGSNMTTAILEGLGLNVTSTAMGTLTASTSSGGTAGIYLYKQNNFCSIRINQIKPTQNSTQTFATIPSGFRPKHVCYIPCVSPTNIFVTVNPNGNLSLNLATTSNLYATGVFMLP